MIAFLKPKALFTGTLILKRTTGKSPLPSKDKTVPDLSHAVVAFSHHRDVKVALDELSNAGFSHDCLTLIARHAERLDNPALVKKNYFELQRFNSNPAAREFFFRLFKRGKYLVSIDGSKYDVNAASKIISRRQNHAEVWHFD